jgi:hypothetical protein
VRSAPGVALGAVPVLEGGGVLDVLAGQQEAQVLELLGAAGVSLQRLQSLGQVCKGLSPHASLESKLMRAVMRVRVRVRVRVHVRWWV